MNIGKIAEASTVTNATAPKTSAQVSEKKETTLASDNTDKFVKSETVFTPAYTKATVTSNNTNTISDEEESGKTAVKNAKTFETDGAETGKAARSDKMHFSQNTNQLKNQLLQDMVSKLISGQSSNSNGTYLENQLKKILGENSFEQTKEDADYWSADSVATRIYDFARSLAGDNDGMFETLKSAFQKGFGQAEGAFNSSKKLPSVCYDTYDKVMSKFDDWEKEINAKKAESGSGSGANVE